MKVSFGTCSCGKRWSSTVDAMWLTQFMRPDGSLDEELLAESQEREDGEEPEPW